MSRLRSNISANFSARVWTGILGYVVVPIYVAQLGIAGYGLVGLFMTLQSVLVLLDFGLSATVNREMARLTSLPGGEHDAAVFLRTVEGIVWAISAAILLIILAGSGFISESWISAMKIAPHEVKQLVRIMALALVVQLPIMLYSSALLGLQKQVTNAWLMGLSSTLRLGGAALVLYIWKGGLPLFFFWNAVIAVVTVIIFRHNTWQQFRLRDAISIRLSLLRTFWRFSAGVAIFGATSVVITQLDKLVLSRLVSIEEFGFYVLASQAAAGLYLLYSPIYIAFLPMFSREAARQDIPKLTELYHLASQTMAVVVIPPAVVLAGFAREFLSLWTGKTAVVVYSSPSLSVLSVGTMVSCLVSIPFALQLAYGYTKLAVRFNLMAVVMLIPLLVFTCAKLGPIGAAIVWLSFNLALLFIAVPIMHRRFLPGALSGFYIEDIGKPVLAIGFVVIVSRAFVPFATSWWWQLITILIVSITAFAAGILSAGRIRSLSCEALKNVFVKMMAYAKLQDPL